jgi:ribosomal protein L22
MSTPGDPQKGKPAEDEQIEREAAEAKEAAPTEAASEAPAGDASDTTAARPAEGTAADVTGVQKPAAEAALRAGSSEPVAASDDEDDAETAADEDAADAAVPDAAETADAGDAGDSADETTPAGRRRGSRGRRRSAAEEPPAPEPSPTRAARERRDGEPVLVRAQARYVRTSARKARLVCDHIRGKSVPEARAILAHTPRAVARDWSKLLESAIANAEHNHELIGDDLRVFAVTADEGPTLKRFRPRAMGRATRIRKRTSHLTIMLTPKE